MRPHDFENKLSMLPNDLDRFERHKSIGMVGDDTRGVVTGGTRCRYLGRIGECAWRIWQGPGAVIASIAGIPPVH